MTKHSLIFVSQPRVFCQLFRLKIAAFPVSPTLGFLLLAWENSWGYGITIAFSFFNPQVVLIFVFFSFFISFTVKNRWSFST